MCINPKAQEQNKCRGCGQCDSPAFVRFRDSKEGF